jgi:hypothetical protein
MLVIGSTDGPCDSCSRCALRAAWGIGLGLLAVARAASAQSADPTTQPELRADVIAARSTTLELAGGAAFPAGDDLLLGGDVGLGAVAGGGLGWRPGARLDVTGRLHLDRSTDTRWAPYLIAGTSYRVDTRARGALYLLAAVGVHAPATHGITSAIEAGLGGGVRVGVVLRRTTGVR